MDESGTVQRLWNALRPELQQLDGLRERSRQVKMSEHPNSLPFLDGQILEYESIVLHGLRKLEKIKGLPPEILGLLLEYDSLIGEVPVKELLFDACRIYLKR